MSVFSSALAAISLYLLLPFVKQDLVIEKG